MSSDVQSTRWERVRPWLVRAALALIPVASALATREGCPRTVEVLRTIEVLVPVLDEFTPTQGWVEEPDEIAANLDPAKTLQFSETPAGKAVMGDEDVYLWRAVRKAAKLDGAAYPNINQGSVGSCVGAGYKHGADAVQATAILRGEAFAWKPVSAEVIYAGSRVEIGGGRISGDGSVGAWAAKWVRDYGLVPMERHGSLDLSAYSAARAREWGRRGAGVPDELEPLAKSHPVKTTALVRTASDVKRALSQGYPVVVCSNQGFTMSRDARGFARPQGTWAHAMCFLGWRNDRAGAFCLNSWGDQAHTGPVWPADMPVAGFWVDEQTVGRMVAQGDSFALSDVSGFPSRNPPLDWFIRAQDRVRVRPMERFALKW